MAISPEEAFNPEYYADTLWWWEQRIDAYLAKFYTGSSEALVFRHRQEGVDKDKMTTAITPFMASVIMRRYP